MDSRIIEKLTENEREFLYGLERGIQEKNIYRMEEWASFFAFEHPELVTKDIAEKIVHCYEQASAGGVSRATLNLGAVYYNGMIVRRDFKKAFDLYQKAAQSEDQEVATRAICNLGYCYFYGRDIPLDYEKAFHHFLAGVLRFEDSNCLYKLGDMYRYGNYVPADEKMAFLLYQKAYQETHPGEDCYADIIKRLGDCALNGIGTKKDPILAIQYLTTAQGYLYSKIYQKRDPYAKTVLADVERLIECAKAELLMDSNPEEL